MAGGSDVTSGGTEEFANAAINSGGNSLGPSRADFGAKVTGDARPFLNIAASSSVIRREVEERSSFKGNWGR